MSGRYQIVVMIDNADDRSALTAATGVVRLLRSIACTPADLRGSVMSVTDPEPTEFRLPLPEVNPRPAGSTSVLKV